MGAACITDRRSLKRGLFGLAAVQQALDGACQRIKIVTHDHPNPLGIYGFVSMPEAISDRTNGVPGNGRFQSAQIDVRPFEARHSFSYRFEAALNGVSLKLIRGEGLFVAIADVLANVPNVPLDIF